MLVSLVVTELCDVSQCGSDWEFVEPQSFSTDTKDEMRYEGSPLKAHPLSRRRMTPRTSVQNSYTSFVRDLSWCDLLECLIVSLILVCICAWCLLERHELLGG